MEQEMQSKSPLVQYLLLLAAACACNCLGSQNVGATESPRCATIAQSRQLDFWLGHWTIVGPDGKPNGTSRVHLALASCVIIESWSGGQGHEGENMFAYSQDDGIWHGMFADNEGRVHVFAGTVNSGVAIFSGPSRGPNGENFLNRITIARAKSEGVMQLWEKSANGGATWSTEFRGKYTR